MPHLREACLKEAEIPAGSVTQNNRKDMHMIKGFKMKLYEGQEAEYERRHNLLWPEMKDMIHEHGGKNFCIFLD